jgi:RNA polymerase-interacting CarD/CdnL/TRCF family regulator
VVSFQVGDKVIHNVFGLGEIVQIEEKIIHNHLTNCYVVQVDDLMIWVPVDHPQQTSLRLPTSPEEFVKVIPILASPNEVLQEDRMLRKHQLVEQLNDGKLASICRLVRDLTHFQRSSKLSDQEKTILNRAIKSLLTEWTLSLGIPLTKAQQNLESLLQS